VYEELNEKVFMGDSVKNPHLTPKQAAADEEEERKETVNYRNKFAGFLGQLKAVCMPPVLFFDSFPLTKSHRTHLIGHGSRTPFHRNFG
jgi:hypothetical protein